MYQSPARHRAEGPTRRAVTTAGPLRLGQQQHNDVETAELLVYSDRLALLSRTGPGESFCPAPLSAPWVRPPSSVREARVYRWRGADRALMALIFSLVPCLGAE